MLHAIKQNLVSNLKNIPGWRTNRKVIVIECDDWGGIRMPSKDTYNKLTSAGLQLDNSRYNMYDTLADNDDLELLFDVLASTKDFTGRHVVMTAVTNVANPDFEKIKASDFEEYFYEPFTRTLQRYGREKGTFELWKQGIEANLFVPESHGREHITVQLWLKKLREGDQRIRVAFDNGFVWADPGTLPVPARQFRPEFYFDSADQVPFLEKSIEDGVKLFEKIFGYKPAVFVPGNGVFHRSLEPAFARTGVPFLYAGHRVPDYDPDGSVTFRRHTFGQKSPLGFRYYMRNCAFEPTDRSYSGIDSTLKQIEAAFTWHKPALISSHRVNFVGKIDPANRDKGLSELKLLLKAIVRNWSDAEFMSSRDLFSLVN